MGQGERDIIQYTKSRVERKEGVLETGGTATNASLSDSCNATLYYCFAIQLYSVNTLPKADRPTSVTRHCAFAQHARKILKQPYIYRGRKLFF